MTDRQIVWLIIAWQEKRERPQGWVRYAVERFRATDAGVELLEWRHHETCPLFQNLDGLDCACPGGLDGGRDWPRARPHPDTIRLGDTSLVDVVGDAGVTEVPQWLAIDGPEAAAQAADQLREAFGF